MKGVLSILSVIFIGYFRLFRVSLTGGLVGCLRFLLVDLFFSNNYDMWMLSSLKVPECRSIAYPLRFQQYPTTARSSKVSILGL